LSKGIATQQISTTFCLYNLLTFVAFRRVWEILMLIL